MLKYEARHYDDHLRLKVSPLLWFILLYGVRHFFMVAASKLMPLDVAATPWVDLQANNDLMWGDMPALLVLLATGHRIPDALRIMRWVWLHGRWILAGSYLLEITVFLYLQQTTLLSPDSPQFFTALSVVLFDILIVGALLRSALIRDIFNEFPEPQAGKELPSSVTPTVISSIRELDQKGHDARRAALLAETIMQHSTQLDVHMLGNVKPEELMLMAENFESKNQQAEAENIYRELLKRQLDFSAAWHALGMLAFEIGKRDHGVSMVEEAVRLDGQAGIYRRSLCEMCRRMDKLEKAIEHGQIACRLSPDDPEAAHYLGLAFTNASRFKQAIEIYRQVLALNPGHVQCWSNLGVALQSTHDLAAAEAAYRQALKLNSAHAEARRNLQVLLSMAEREKIKGGQIPLSY